MKNWISLVLRGATTIGLLAVQVYFFLMLLRRVVNFIPIFTAVSYLVSVIIVLLLIKRNKPSAHKVIWIIVILILPIAGGVLYIIFGNDFLTERARKRTREEHETISKLLRGGGIPLRDEQCGRAGSLLNYIKTSSSYSAYENTQTKYYPFGQPMYEDLLDALKGAEKFIFMQYFIIGDSKMWDGILEILLKKAEEGVDVRLIFDDAGSYALFSSKYFTYIQSKGIKVFRFNPMRPMLSLFMNHRDHRKFTVADGRTAFTGGINIVDRTINQDRRFPNFKDTNIRLQGEAVWSFTLMFIERWNTFSKPEVRIDDYEQYRHDFGDSPNADGLVIPYGDSPLESERLGENVYIDILNQAKRYVYIFTPYLIISEKMLYALQMAAKRGIDVRIVTSSVDKNKLARRLSRSHYTELIDSGVRIFEYLPGFFHAKSFVSDDELAVVGSINLDYRSLYLHFECAALLYKTSSAADILLDAEETMANSREILQGDTKRRFGGELLDAVLHLFAPLM